MFKEVVISIVIVISIILLDFVTQNYTKETVAHTSEMLSNLEEKIKINEKNGKREDKN